MGIPRAGSVIEDRNANTPARINQKKKGKKEAVAPLCGGGGAAERNRSSDIGIKSDRNVITHHSKLWQIINIKLEKNMLFRQRSALSAVSSNLACSRA